MSSFYLKIIGLITMLIDHIGSILNLMPMRYIGRIAFPIYAFLIAEGCFYTKNIKKYIIRLFIFGLISQVPFAMFAGNSSLFSYLNIFFTLSLGVLSIYAYKAITSNIFNAGLRAILIFFTIFGLAFFAEIINVDYGAMGVVLIYWLYMCKTRNFSLLVTKLMQAFIILSFLLLIYPLNEAHGTYLVLGGSFSLIPILLYNSKSGRPIKWLFYVFYPLHLVVLVLIKNYFL